MSLRERVDELKKDLLHDSVPQISIMGNYPFAILQYEPEEEFKMRELIGNLVEELRHQGWKVRDISLLELLLKRLQNDEDNAVEVIISGERSKYERSIRKKQGLEPGLNYLRDMMAEDLEGPQGLATDVIREIREMVAEEDKGQTLVFLSRAGALYPFYRTSGLLRFLDGNTARVPVILLYPGSRSSNTGLSFMGEYQPDLDYRPRIY
ncbi:BREX protein BrxB domain-containing protein [Deltaproteobacteria bacterium TL4]